MDNRENRTINYVIKEDGFNYHMKKGVMKAGSVVSKAHHPIDAVEEYKRKLIMRRYLVDEGEYYICRRNITTGLLMAYNMHCGYLVKEMPQFKVVINGNEGEDVEIKDAFAFKNLISADNLFRKRISKDSYRIEIICKAEYNRDFYEGKKKTGLSSIEQFVADALIEAKVLENYRVGDPEKKECDLVDEINNRQIEIVRFFDEKFPQIAIPS